MSTTAVLTQVHRELKKGQVRALLHVAGVWTSAAVDVNWLWWMTTTLCRSTVCRPKRCCPRTAMPTALLGTQSLRTCCASQEVASCPPRQQTSHCTSRKCRYHKLLTIAEHSDHLLLQRYVCSIVMQLLQPANLAVMHATISCRVAEMDTNALDA